MISTSIYHDDVIKWNHFPRYWSFVRGIHPSPDNALIKASDASFDVFKSVTEQTVE